MPARLVSLLRLLALPVLIWAGFVAYGYSLHFIGDLIEIPKERSLIYGAFMAQGFLAAATISILFCYPLAFIYRNSAAGAAIAMTIPVLVLTLHDFSVADSSVALIAVTAYVKLAYVVLLVFGTWLAKRHLVRTDTAGQ